MGEGSLIFEVLGIFLETLRDVAPIIAVLLFFQFAVLRKPITNLRRTLVGFSYVVAGLALFLIGLEQALFPLGESMAKQLTDPAFVGGTAFAEDGSIAWWQYSWVYLFGAAIGFATTIAEPSLIAVSIKASEASGGALKPWALRIAAAIGVALSVTISIFRIVTGTPLHLYMLVGYVFVIIQTIFAPKEIVPLAYDSGGVTTSTVTVPIVTALGLGLATTVPGRSPLLDGFGLIALACLFPIMTIMGYAQLSQLKEAWNLRRAQTPPVLEASDEVPSETMTPSKASAGGER